MSVQLSVIIPALNEAATIQRAVASAQALGALDVIVVDGGSGDDTAPLARQAGATVEVSAQGRAVQQNHGANQARGGVLLFLHADNWLPPEAAAQLAAALADQRVVCGAFRQQIEADGFAFRCLEWGNAWRARWLGLPYGDQAIFVRRADFEACGGFPATPILEEVYLMRRLRGRGRLALLPGPLYVSARRWRRRGIARQTLRNWRILLMAALGASPQRLARLYPADR